MERSVQPNVKILFFDMEFANGQVPGSIYSFGYTVTDGDFRVLVPPTDILIDPCSTWNGYVEENILAYPKEEVESSPTFIQRYTELSALFADVDIAVGFSVSNDNRALRKACERDGLPPLSYTYFDVERLCRMLEEHKDAHGLRGYYTAWCGEEPKNSHRSDGDALATMGLLQAVCRAKHVTAEMMIKAYPECVGETNAPVKKASPKKRRRRPRQKRRTERGAAVKGSGLLLKSEG